jgi:hypothetical protein
MLKKINRKDHTSAVSKEVFDIVESIVTILHFKAIQF